MASSLFSRNSRTAYLMSAPALSLLFFFLILPFLSAFYLTFTNQRLLNPNETKLVGLRNYDRLLSLNFITQEADGTKTVVDEDGKSITSNTYPRLRRVLRKDPAYKGYREFFDWEIGTTRYVVLAKDPLFYRSFLQTLLFALLVVPLQGTLALLMAMLVNKELKGRNFFRTIFFSPVVTSMVVVSIVWAFLYNKDLGLINEYLQTLTFGLVGPIDWLGDSRYTMIAIVIMSAWQGAGFQMLIFLAGLQSISETLYEAAELDGANGFQKFWYITLPGLSNTIVFIVISTTIAAFALFTQVDVMTHGGPNDATSTVMYHVVRKGFREQDIAYGSTISVIYFVTILLISLGQKKYMDSRK